MFVLDTLDTLDTFDALDELDEFDALDAGVDEFDDDYPSETCTLTHWVGAEPFRAWLGHLTAATGMEPLAIGVAAGIPTRVARSLATPGVRPRRIRAIDALGLLALDPGTLLANGQQLGDARPAHLSLLELRSFRPSVGALADALNVGFDTAEGLTDGWLEVCQLSTIWRCIALASQITFERAYGPKLGFSDDSEEWDGDWEYAELKAA